MKPTHFIIPVLVAAVLLMPLVLADLSISGSSSFSGPHNAAVQIPFTVSSTANVTNVTLTITNITNPAQILSIDLTNSGKLSIAAGQSKDYTINYTISQYTAPGTYPATINVSAQVNETGVSQSEIKAVNITVTSSKTFESIGAISVESPTSTRKSVSFSLKNSGNVNLTNISVSQASAMEDEDGDEIDVTVTSSSNGTLTPGASKTMNLSVDVPANIALRSYSTTLTITSAEGATTDVSLTVNVKQTFCDSGAVGGFFDLEIKEPDSGDDFYPQDTIPIEVTVDNRDRDERDVVITANLYDTTDEEFLDEEVETTGTVNDHDSEDFTLELTVPNDVADHSHRVYVKVAEDGEEDTQCKETSVSIDIKKETHSIVIDKVSLPEILNCGDAVDASVTLANTGKRDEDVNVRITNAELKINEERSLDIDEGDKRTVSIPLRIPTDAKEKSYVLNILTQYHLVSDAYEQSRTGTATLKVEGNCDTSTSNTVVSLELLSQPYIGERFGVRVQVFNIGTEKAVYKIAAADYDGWARLELVEPATVTVDPGRSESAIIYLTPTTEVQGDRKLRVTAISGSTETEEEVTVNIKEKLKASTAYQRWVERLSNLSGFDLATVNIVLIVAIILIFAWVLRARRSA